MRPPFSRSDFGKDFAWGVAASAFQTEGSPLRDGKGLSIWDTFSSNPANILDRSSGERGSDFYRLYIQDLILMRGMNIRNFRFSLSWSRIMPTGMAPVNPKGLDFYDRVITQCLELGIEPWITLYHWDLPQALEDQGGWTDRDIVGRFSDYVALCVRHFGDRVSNWMVLNEPLAFTGAGYFLGRHAPGRKGLSSFLSAAHHAALCQAEGSRIIRSESPGASIGSTYSASLVQPLTASASDAAAARRMDALLNRIFLEPVLGLGYPVKDLPVLQRMERWIKQEDERRLAADLDFVGLQLYTREVVSSSQIVPFVNARLVPAAKRGVPVTEMQWEVWPDSLLLQLGKLAAYQGVKKIIVTENGAAFPDSFANGSLHDPLRVSYLQDHIGKVLEARRAGVPVEGYFAWSFTDNFEWAEGLRPRFGLVHVNYADQKRTIKDSGKWYRDFLGDSPGEVSGDF